MILEAIFFAATEDLGTGTGGCCGGEYLCIVGGGQLTGATLDLCNGHLVACLRAGLCLGYQLEEVRVLSHFN
jgi:hypothetical protein